MAINSTLLANQSVNTTLRNGTQLLIEQKDSFLGLMLQRAWDIITAPGQYPEMLWIITPLVVALLLMEFYFGRYTDEELGWNTAVANSLVLIFVAIDLLRFVYGDNSILTTDVRDLAAYNFKATVIAIGIAGGGFLLMFTEFFHALPKKLAFFVSSTLPINLIAYLSIVLVYSDVPLDLYTLGAAIVIFFILLGVFKLIHMIEPSAKEDPPNIFETNKGIMEEVKE